jgi:hypothetical protein
VLGLLAISLTFVSISLEAKFGEFIMPHRGEENVYSKYIVAFKIFKVVAPFYYFGY